MISRHYHSLLIMVAADDLVPNEDLAIHSRHDFDPVWLQNTVINSLTSGKFELNFT